MEKNNKKKESRKIYFIALSIYFTLIIISLIICYLTNAKDYLYMVVILCVSIIYIFLFLITCYDILYKVNENDVEEIKFKYVNAALKNTVLNLMKNGQFENQKDIFFKSYSDGKNKYRRYIYFSNLDRFDKFFIVLAVYVGDAVYSWRYFTLKNN